MDKLGGLLHVWWMDGLPAGGREGGHAVPGVLARARAHHGRPFCSKRQGRFAFRRRRSRRPAGAARAESLDPADHHLNREAPTSSHVR
jgi:hypothetical protein